MAVGEVQLKRQLKNIFNYFPGQPAVLENQQEIQNISCVEEAIGMYKELDEGLESVKIKQKVQKESEENKGETAIGKDKKKIS